MLTVLFLALLGLALPSTARAAPVCAGCNVLWIVIDTTRADRLGVYGGPPVNTPNLDRLAARGTTWEHAYSQAPSTMLSVSSYFSGRYRLSTGQMFTMNQRREHFNQLSPEVTTVAEVLEQRGYRIDGYVANGVIAPAPTARFQLRVHQGFDTWVQVTDQAAVDQGSDRLAELKASGEPWMLYLHLLGPHAPNDRFEGFEARRGQHPSQFGDVVEPAHYLEINTGRTVPTAADLAYINALYDDAVFLADRQVGQVLDRLEQRGLAEKTLVIVTSDHGETLGEYRDPHPHFGHSHSLIDALLNVPLIIAGPGIPEGRVERDQVAELVDLAPTLASYLGIPVQNAWEWDGEPLFGPQAAQGPIALSDRGGVGYMQTGARDTTHAVRYYHENGLWRYMVLPEEQVHVKPPTSAHKALQAAAQAYMDSAHPPKVAGETLEAPEDDELEMLRALGYVE